MDRLFADGHHGAKQTAETILTKSPTALKATLAAVRRARTAGTLEEVLDVEYRASCAALRTPDLVEGIRAQVIDKDRMPKWVPGELGAVTPADVARFSAVPPGGDLGLSGALC